MKDKFVIFIKQNGFLLFLFICVCAVAAGTIYVSTTELREARNGRVEDLVILEEIDSEDTENTAVPENIEVSYIDEEIDDEVIKDEALNDELETEEEVVDALAEDAEEDIEFIDDYEEDDTNLVTDEHKAGFLPIDGKIITNISEDTLIYSTTLDEWRYHAGIDIKAPVGTEVKVPLSGTVKEIIEDDLWGITIIIDHGNGLESKYSNLGTKEMVKVGIGVNVGDFISVVGDTAKIEMKMEPHLHYEVSKNGKNIDPRSITE
ncbi:MAG: peptidoglycan DD-metalloendopeptidase family protein [Tissierellia bacterium]|nr:peptidoglycan DD-metalloendopeptidase family protein [Tissierellia bacterium]MDD4726092.1 peptidoglycan DD-metalloendopeptidase family protein [Tissierellia bacterium]